MPACKLDVLSTLEDISPDQIISSSLPRTCTSVRVSEFRGISDLQVNLEAQPDVPSSCSARSREYKCGVCAAGTVELLLPSLLLLTIPPASSPFVWRVGQLKRGPAGLGRVGSLWSSVLPVPEHHMD